MSATRWASDELIEVLACDIDSRPEAPGAAELAPFVIAARRTPTQLVLELDPAGIDIARAFVAAECVCCSSIAWELIEAPAALRITATESQVEALTALVPTTIDIERVQ